MPMMCSHQQLRSIMINVAGEKLLNSGAIMPEKIKLPVS
jgi:hypothetical protein